MAGLVLDSGALIAGERGDRRFWTAFKDVQLRGTTIVIPSLVIAQVWRDPSQAIVARLVKASEVVAMDLAVARDVGRLCAASGTADIVDAMVVVVAHRLDADVATSDTKDIRVLMDAIGCRGRILPV